MSARKRPAAAAAKPRHLAASKQKRATAPAAKPKHLAASRPERATAATAKPKRPATPKPKRPATAKPKRPAATRRGAPDDALLDQLVAQAKKARGRAYAPYSHYEVGAAIATKSGEIFTGCNVENASFGATICAERGAIMQMVAAGARDPVACAIVTGDEEGAAPCGLCRQVLVEFARDMTLVLVGTGSPDGAAGRVVQLADLLPMAFELRR